MADSRVGDFLAGQHARNLLFPRFGIQGNDLGSSDSASAFLDHPEMVMSLAGDLRQVGDAKDLPVPGQSPEFESDPFGDATADSGIDFIKDQCRDPLGVGRAQLEGQGQTG